MPTLIQVPLNASMESDQEPRGHDGETFINEESTRMFDETMLGNESIDESLHNNRSVAPFDEDSRVEGFSYGFDNDETRLTDLNDETRLGGADATTLHNDDTVLNIARRMLHKKDANDGTVLQYDKPEPAKRTTGPKEVHYTRHFERYVSHVITDYERQYPGKLKNYRSMSQSEKEREQSRVNALLARLGGTTTTNVLQCHAHDAVGPLALAETSGESSATRLSVDHDNSLTESQRENLNLTPPPANDSFASASSRENNDAEMFSECNQSSNLLSSESEVDELAARMNQSMGLMSPDVGTSPLAPPQRTPPTPDDHMAHNPDDDSSEASSVELVRRTDSARSTPSSQMYQSPTITTNRSSKRMASASGKRGTDQSRMRLDEDSFASFDASIVRPSEMISSPSQLLRSSHTSPDSPLFQASQSPIDDAFSSAEKNRVESAGRARLQVFEDPSPLNNANDDTLQSHDVTANYRRKVRWNEESFLQEIPANVHLKEGAPFRMKPLRVGRPTRQDRQVAIASLPDPLRHYEGALRKKVKAAYTWMKEREVLSEDDDEEVNGGLLFSMSVGAIIDVTMKLCIKHQSNHNQGDMDEDEVMSGGTLVVARSKEDLVEWESSLRECTCFSVLNHSTMPVDDRKRKATANRCAGYDVVLTTFDAIKSKDVATPLDSKGHAIIHEKADTQDGWFASRSSGSQPAGRVEQLSVLHQINWRRIIFVDALGRKSFVAKQATARAVAAVAIGSSSRFLFFPKDPDDDDKVNPVDVLAKSDKNSFKSVAAVLRLNEAAAVGGRLSESMFDMNDVKVKTKPPTRNRRQY